MIVHITLASQFLGHRRHIVWKGILLLPGDNLLEWYPVYPAIRGTIGNEYCRAMYNFFFLLHFRNDWESSDTRYILQSFVI